MIYESNIRVYTDIDDNCIWDCDKIDIGIDDINLLRIRVCNIMDKYVKEVYKNIECGNIYVKDSEISICINDDHLKDEYMVLCRMNLLMLCELIKDDFRSIK